MPEIKDLAVWFIFNPPREPVLLPVHTPEEAVLMIFSLSKAMLVTDAVEANAFGLMEFDGEEWTEWESEDGDQINEWQMF